jgi:hypothetical protein
VSSAERGAADSAQRIAAALEAAGISYAIGGALALAIAGVPRGTADVDVNVFAPEALAVFKLLFFRGKDLVDLERLVAVRPELDAAYVRRHIALMMGEDDERTRRWEEITARFGAGGG